MSRKRRTFPTDSDYLLEQGIDITSRQDREEEHTLSDALRDALETLHDTGCQGDLCRPTCEFSLLIAHYYERLSVADLVRRYGFRNKGSITWRLEKAKRHLKEAVVEQIGYDPYENTTEVITT